MAMTSVTKASSSWSTKRKCSGAVMLLARRAICLSFSPVPELTNEEMIHLLVLLAKNVDGVLAPDPIGHERSRPESLQDLRRFQVLN
jgi:hypothetical protein